MKMNNLLIKFAGIMMIFMIIISGCSTLQENSSNDSITITNLQTEKMARTLTYEEDLLPFIINQLNDTASAFYSVLPDGELAGNRIVGDNETKGVCRHYVSHFIESYKGPGDLYEILVDEDWITYLIKRIKILEKTDINIDFYSGDEKSKIGHINRIYNKVMQSAENNYSYCWSFTSTFAGHNYSINLYTNDNGVTYMLDETIIQTPASHANETDFNKHTWVRIIWNGLTVDVEPTWYDNGFLLEDVITIIEN